MAAKRWSALLSLPAAASIWALLNSWRAFIGAGVCGFFLGAVVQDRSANSAAATVSLTKYIKILSAA
jgi:hypothetical protein